MLALKRHWFKYLFVSYSFVLFSIAIILINPQEKGRNRTHASLTVAERLLK